MVPVFVGAVERRRSEFLAARRADKFQSTSTGCKPFSFSGFEKIVQQLRKKIAGLPSHFTLDACRHGGMTELEEAGLTEGQGRALSGHKTAQAYQGYAKETFDRALSATRRRHAHRVVNETATDVRNEGQNGVRNETTEQQAANAK